MNPFIAHSIAQIHKKYGSFEDLIFVVPSIRAGTYLRHCLSEHISKPIFSPIIWGIEAFIGHISQLTGTSNTELLFDLYTIYQQSSLKNKDDFHAFTKWANTLLADFDEIDRYLIDPHAIFDYLTEVKKIHSWNLAESPTKMVTDYISFAQQLKLYHHQLRTHLLEKNSSYQGLRYRIAVDKLSIYLNDTKDKKHVFLGFNALNKAESTIIQQILKETSSEIYWDLDTHFSKDPLHGAGYFINAHIKSWDHFKNSEPQGFSNDYLSNKEIHITGIPKSISQAKYVGNLIKELYSSNPNAHIALVLADETLLPSILNSIPEVVNEVNITMGYPLGNTSISDFFHLLLDFYIQQSKQGWHHKDVLRLLSHAITKSILNAYSTTLGSDIQNRIIQNNHTYITPIQLGQWLPDNISLKVKETTLSSESFLEICISIANHLQIIFRKNNLIEFEAVRQCNAIFNQLDHYLRQYEFLKELKNLKTILVELVSLETVNFKGSPLKGLQIMGMLETRALDFETVIMTSVNEGILPAGKSNNSFIPYDVKRAFDLPTFKEKDNVYTYHFYRLLQRAKNIYLTYNTEPDVLEGGEKSRLILQLMADEKLKPFITHSIATPKVIVNPPKVQTVTKTPQLMARLYDIAASGFSPTSLTTYIKNPLSFYKQYVLGIRDVQNVEETIAHNTFGTIVHDTLEELYQPLLNQSLSPRLLNQLKPLVETEVTKQFGKHFGSQSLDQGQLLIVFQVVVKYIKSALDFEIKQLEQHQITITALEQKIQIPLKALELETPVVLKGKIDRVETIDGITRILDYKTGQTSPSDVVLVSYEELLEKETKAKAFQLLCYGLLYAQHYDIATLKAGILSIKNLNLGVLEFAQKPSPNARVKNTLITADVLQNFQEVLHQLILEILNPAIPFTDRESDLF